MTASAAPRWALAMALLFISAAATASVASAAKADKDDKKAGQATGALSASGAMIDDALAGLPKELEADMKEIMKELYMTTETTHFERFVSRGGFGDGVVNQSMALIKYPTADNNFTLDFIKLTADLDPAVEHALLVCGHSRPDACGKQEVYPGAHPDHPCGVTDSTDPDMANKTGAFCEILHITETTEDGELLMYGSEVLEALAEAHAAAVASGKSPQAAVLSLEVIEADELAKMLGVEDMDGDEDMDIDMDMDEDKDEEDEDEDEDEDATDAADAADADADDTTEPPTRRRQLLGRFGGAGMRRGGVTGGFRGGMAGGMGRMGRRRGVGRGVSLVEAGSFYSRPGLSSQAASFFVNPRMRGL